MVIVAELSVSHSPDEVRPKLNLLHLLFDMNVGRIKSLYVKLRNSCDVT